MLIQALSELECRPPRRLPTPAEYSRPTPTCPTKCGRYRTDPDIRAAQRRGPNGWDDCKVSPVIERYGGWVVTTYGVECLTQPYFFEFARVDEPDWLDHMNGKTWVVMPDFAAALAHARRLAPSERNPKRA